MNGAPAAEAAGHAHMLAAMRVFAQLPGGFEGERDGVAWRIGPLPLPPLNRVMARGADDAAVAAAIAVHAGIVARGHAAALFLGPHDAARLAAVRAQAEAAGLVFRLAARLMLLDLPARATMPARISVAPVATAAEAAAWVETCRRSFDGEAPAFRPWAAALADPASPLRRDAVHLLARRAGEVVGCGMLAQGAGLAGLYAVGTVPGARRQGVGQAVSLAAAALAQGWGCAQLSLQSTAAGLDLYRRLGFAEYGDYAVFTRAA